MKPLNKKAYGSIPHLPGSRLGPGEHFLEPGMVKIVTETGRDKWDKVYVEEKLDGSNVSVVLLNGELVPLTRRGYVALSSPYEQHHYFDAWVRVNSGRFLSMLNEGERACGEWLLQAHGTKYDLTEKEPFVLFDLITGTTRVTVEERQVRGCDFTQPYTLSEKPIPVEEALRRLGEFGYHGATEQPEGAVWRAERLSEGIRGKPSSQVLFLSKYVRPDKVDGKYFGPTPDDVVWNVGAKEIMDSLKLRV